MAYATVADIQAFYQNVTFSASSIISTSDVEARISAWEAIVDRKLSTRTSTPLSDATDILLAKEVVCKAVAGDIDAIMRNSGKLSQTDKPRDLASESRKLLNEILEGKIPLANSSGSLVGFETEDSDGEDIVPFFQRNLDY